MVEKTRQNQTPDAGSKGDASCLNPKFQPKALLTEGIHRKVTLREFRDIIRENANYKEKLLFETSITDLKGQFAKRSLPEPDDEELAKLENLKQDGGEVFLWVKVEDKQFMAGRTDVFSVRMADGKLSVYGGCNALSGALYSLGHPKNTEFLTDELAQSFSMILNRLINHESVATVHLLCWSKVLIKQRTLPVSL